MKFILRSLLLIIVLIDVKKISLKCIILIYNLTIKRVMNVIFEEDVFYWLVYYVVIKFLVGEIFPFPELLWDLFLLWLRLYSLLFQTQSSYSIIKLKLMMVYFIKLYKPFPLSISRLNGRYLSWSKVHFYGIQINLLFNKGNHLTITLWTWTWIEIIKGSTATNKR